MIVDRCKDAMRCPQCGEIIPAEAPSVRSMVGIRFARLHYACWLRARAEHANRGPIREKRT